MVDLVILAALASTTAHFLRERRDLTDRSQQKILEEYQEYVRRSEHSETIAMLLTEKEALNGIARVLRDAQDCQHEQLHTLQSRVEALLCTHLEQFLSTTDRLSKVPRSHRQQLDLPLVGRDTELGALEIRVANKSDTVVVGQPGAGKTYLLHHFVQVHDGWFVHATGAGILSEALRLHRSSLLVVDDAGAKADLIAELKQIRREFDLHFVIIVAGWPSESETLCGLLGCTTSALVTLEPTSRNNLVKILDHAGFKAPPRIISHIVDQSRNRPGLAVTLADTAMRHQSGWGEVWRGDAIATQVRDWFRDRLPADTLRILAGCAIAGGEGFTITQIAALLKIDTWDVQARLKTLAPAGIIELSADGRVVVVPEPLRFPLLQEHFFCGQLSIDWRPFVDALHNRAEFCLNLVGLAARRAPVNPQLLLDQLRLIEPSQATTEGHHPWTAYCYLGSEQVQTCINRFPADVDRFARPALETAPDIAIPWLMHHAEAEEPIRTHALGAVLGWMKDEHPDDPAALANRTAVIDAVMKESGLRKDENIKTRLLVAAMSPTYSSSQQDPGSHRSVSISQGTLHPDQLCSLGERWSDVLSVVSHADNIDWPLLLQLASDWGAPEFHLHLIKENEAGQRYKHAVGEAMIPVCRIMVADLANLAKDNPAVRHQLSDLAERLHLQVDVPTDELFELLYFDPISEANWESAETQHAQKIELLAAEWSVERPDMVAQRLHELASKAQEVGTFTYDWTAYLCRCIAAGVENILAWSHAIVQKRCPSRLLAPFLEQVACKRPQGWDKHLSELLALEPYEQGTIGLLLRTDDAPDELRQTALERAEKLASWLLGFCVRSELSKDTIKSLLIHESSNVRAEVCRGVLLLHKNDDIPQDVLGPWMDSVVDCVEEDHVLVDVFERFPEVAKPWLRARISNAQTPWYQFRQSLSKAVAALTTAERLDLLGLFPDGGYHRQVIQLLVGDDPEIYSQYLDHHPPRYDRTWPLHRLEFPGIKFSTDLWLRKAVVALDHGIEPGEIAFAPLYPGAAYNRGTDLWDERVTWYESMLAHPDSRVHDVARAGIEMAKEQRKRDEDEERRIELEGI